MAMREIDENEYAELKRVVDVAKLIETNPAARQKLQEAVALAAPDRAGPEIRIRQEVTERVSGIEKMLGDFISEQKTKDEERAAEAAKRDLEQRWASTKAKAREAGYTAEGLEALEAWMEKHGVADHTIAIPAFERENPPPEPISTGGSRFDWFNQPKDEGPDLKLLTDMNDNGEAWLRQAIPFATKEARGQ